MSIAGAIERNRIALLRLVFCWLSAAYLIHARADRPLPRRLSAWVLDRIITAEKAALCLLVAIFYSNQAQKRLAPNFEKVACMFMSFNSTFTLGALTLGGLIKRLKSLRHIVLHLHIIVQRLACMVVARAWVEAMNVAAQSHTLSQHVFMTRPALKLEDAAPP